MIESKLFTSMQARDHRVEICGPMTGHTVAPIAFCTSDEVARIIIAGLKALDLLDPAANWLKAAAHVATDHTKTALEANAAEFGRLVDEVKGVFQK